VLRALALFLIVFAVAPAWGSEPLSVVTTTTDLRALVEAIGGDRVRVESLISPGQDPHSVELRASQVARLKNSSLLVRIGLDHETWLARALRAARLGTGSPHDLDVSRRIRLLQTETPRLRERSATHVHGFGNTHYWLDPANARPITEEILEALARLAPDNRSYFEANRTRFLQELDAGIERWTQAMAPFQGTRVVVFHESWPYFAERFGLVVVAAVESAPGIPPSPSVLAVLPERMRESGIKILIAEPYSDPAVVRQIAARSGARAVTLVPSVGADPEARDYIALFDVNIARLTAALASEQ
jgi:ABC-type Zn uptake system ZnuABC Zn-binding protein ZnuA